MTAHDCFVGGGKVKRNKKQGKSVIYSIHSMRCIWRAKNIFFLKLLLNETGGLGRMNGWMDRWMDGILIFPA